MSDNLNDAATAVMTAELNALTAISDALTEFSSKLDAALGGLDYPANFQSDAKRIGDSLKMSVTWPVNDIAQRLAALKGDTQGAAPTA